MTADTVVVERLLEHASWLEGLARRLAGDTQLASDLSQDTWVQALEHPPRTDQPLRGWLAVVMRNALLQRRRGEGRRAAREEGVARPEAQPSVLDLVERVATQRSLARHVLELAEPYRTTLLLRFYEGLEPRHVAERQGVPVATVKTRLTRGLESLRERLDRSAGGDGQAWLAGLAPLLRPRAGTLPGAVSSATKGALLVNAKVLVALAVLGAVAASVVAISRPSDERGGVPLAAASAAAEPEAPGALAAASEEPAVTTTRRAAPPPAAAAEAKDAPPDVAGPVLVRGRVIDVDQRPIPGVVVEHTGSDERIESAADGSFELAVTGRGGRFRCVDERFATVLEGTEIAASTGRESVVVVAPRLRLAGRVVDADGVPVAGAAVRLLPPPDLRARITTVLDHSADRAWGAETGADGTFRLEEAPALRGATLEAGADGFLSHEEPAPLVDRVDLLLVLSPSTTPSGLVRGQVVDGSGIPLADALVSLGADTTRSDGEGLFAFEVGLPDSYTGQIAAIVPELRPERVLAVKAGYLPGSARAGHDEEGLAVWPDPLVVRLGGPPLSIAGRVVDADGEPLSGVPVWIDDPTFFGALGSPRAGDRPRLVHAESLLAGTESFEPTVTGEDGRFRIPGLLDRDYRVSALVPRTLLRVDRRDVRAGTEGLVLTIPADATFPVLRGRVVDGSGRAVAGAEVFPMCDTFRTQIAGRTVSTRHGAAEAVQTDDDGRFELLDVPRDLVYLRVNGEDTIPCEWGRHVEGGLSTLVDDPGRFEVVVSRRCHFRVELDDPSEADELAVLDEDGRELVISEFRGNSRHESERYPLVEGRSSTLAVADSARTLVLFRGGQEVRRAPIRLAGGEERTLHP